MSREPGSRKPRLRIRLSTSATNTHCSSAKVFARHAVQPKTQPIDANGGASSRHRDQGTGGDDDIASDEMSASTLLIVYRDAASAAKLGSIHNFGTRQSELTYRQW